MKYPLWRRLQRGKWFRFPRWSTRRRIGHLSPCAMMDHFGFIMAHGRRSRVYRRLSIGRAAFGERSELAGTTTPRGESVRPGLNDRPAETIKSSKRLEGMPAFGLPVLSVIFLVESVLFQIYWNKPCIFVWEVRMKCLCRFIFRGRVLHGSTILHALRPVSPHFRKCARFFENTSILDRSPEALWMALVPTTLQFPTVQL
jgi:hypothetical protein